MEDSARDFEIFLEVQSGLPRQGPGSDESTLKALSYCAKLPDNPEILDIGCGPGTQTLVLAKALNGRITAVDVIQEYLNQLKDRAHKANISDSIQILSKDMNDLEFAPESFDLIWAEGSAYIMGFEKALNGWKQFLKPRGYLAVSELVWIKSDPPSELFQFFNNEYPAMTDVETNLSKLKASGYEITGHFTLPDNAWWDNYYTPLEAKLPGLHEKYSDDDEALLIINMTESEIEMRRSFAEWYGYEFFIGRNVQESTQSP